VRRDGEGKTLRREIKTLAATNAINASPYTATDVYLMSANGNDTNDTSLTREIERAWLQHEPQRNAIPQEIWRQLRQLKRTLEPTSKKIKTTLQDEASLRSLVVQCTRRRGKARQRLLKDNRNAFPDAQIKVVHGNILEISWLTPSPPVLADPKDRSQRQDCTLASFCVAWPTLSGIRLCSAWSLEVPDHAGGRYLQRAGNDADFRSALFEAGNHFYAADVAAVSPHIGRNTDIYLPAGGGCFVCTCIGARSGANKFVYARAATWIDETMLRPDQVPLPKAETADRSVAALLLE